MYGQRFKKPKNESEMKFIVYIYLYLQLSKCYVGISILMRILNRKFRGR